jgi:Neprosin
MATRGLRFCIPAVVMGTIIALAGVPEVASAASGPVCGNAADTAAHCYVEAQQASSNGQPDIISMAGVFTVPKKLAVKAPAYSIAQITLGYYPVDVELGWIVAPGEYHGSTAPHLFVYFRRALGSPTHQCEEGLPATSLVPRCPSNDYVKLSSEYSAGMTLSGPSAFFYVAYDKSYKSWYIQYQNQYIAKMSENWWTVCGAPLGICSNFEGTDNIFWYGEVYTPSDSGSYPCTPMGNGKYGSNSNSASVSDMEYGEGGAPLAPARALMLVPTYKKYWNTNRAAGQTFSSSFNFGGPGDC